MNISYVKYSHFRLTDCILEREYTMVEYYPNAQYYYIVTRYRVRYHEPSQTLLPILNSKLRLVQHLQRSECCAACRSRFAPHNSRLLWWTDGLRPQLSLIQNMTQKDGENTSTFQWCFVKAARTGSRRASPALASPPDSTITCIAAQSQV